MRVCVVGAGCSGLVSVKALLEAGHQVRCFDLASGVGGLWVKGSDNGQSAAYDSLRINTSRTQMEFGDFPMPEEYGDYATADQVATYFRDYSTHFDLERWISFRTCVESATFTGNGYRVQTRHLDSGFVQTDDFDALIVASGHHYAPAFPSPMPSGHFDGETLHSHAYRNPDRPVSLRGRTVVVVGFGNSAVDIAAELAGPGTAQVFLSTRRGAWVLPRYLRGRPIDQGTIVPHWLPARLRRRLVTWGFRRLVGSMPDFGLPEPDHLIGEAHPTLSDELPGLVRSGKISIRPSISRFEGNGVHFTDGSACTADAIVYCTGYQVTFPFLSTEHVSVQGNELPLYRHVFHPEHRRLFFVGLVQPVGAVMPIADLQARWIAAHLSGTYHLPEQNELERDIEEQQSRLKRRYVPSPRHTMQVDPQAYERAVRREWQQGQKRARRGRGQSFSGGSLG